MFGGEFFKLVSLKGWNIMYECMYEQLEEIPVKRGEINEPNMIFKKSENNPNIKKMAILHSRPT